MKFTKKWKGALAVGLFAMMCSPVFAQDSSDDLSQYLPEILHQDGISYTTGGIGADETSALKANARHYNLFISNSEKNGSFTDNTSITITGKQATLTVNDAGPLFYAKLPPGVYVVKAANGDQRSERTVSVTNQKQEQIHFIWQGRSVDYEPLVPEGIRHELHNFLNRRGRNRIQPPSMAFTLSPSIYGHQ